jgi:hypothetical protein
MIDKIKTYAKENKFDLIEKGSMLLGAILGIVVVAFAMAVSKDQEPVEDIVEINI